VAAGKLIKGSNKQFSRKAVRARFSNGVAILALSSGGVFAQTADISVPELPLSDALKAIARQTGENILFTPDSVSGLKAHALSGQMSAREAVDELIRGINLEAVSDGHGGLIVRRISFTHESMHLAPRLEAPAQIGTTSSIIKQNAANSALAQDTSTTDAGTAPAVEEVVVTGTSIRGVSSIGSSLVTLDQQTIQDTGAEDVEQLMQTVPSISNANAVTQGEIRSDYYAPSIHDLGASASNSTLILIDGTRVPAGNTQHSEIDPNIIPLVALERVEVLATGASSVYGSDAVAGVINFITRPNYDGLQVSVQGGVGDDYDNYTANLLFGKSWNDGSVMFAYTHLFESDLPNSARASYVGGNHTAEGGTNFDSFDCASPTLKVGSAYWLGPSYTSSTTSATANAPCNISPYGDLLPQETRDNSMFKVTQRFGNLTVTADLIYALRQDYTINAPGTGSVTVYGPGTTGAPLTNGQINPFFQAPAGNPTATSETVDFFAQGLVPPGYTDDSASTIYSKVQGVYNINDNWEVTLSNTLGRDTTRSVTIGNLCGSCVDLALNGTTNASGSLTTPSIPGTNTIVLGLPLTTSNALDIWDPPGATNKTSAAVLAGLTNSQSSNIDYNSFDQLRVVVDGALFDLPAGPLKIAGGAEYINYNLIQDVTAPNNTGPASTGSSFNEYRFNRDVQSAFLELEVPVISPEMAIPLVNKFDVDISGRIDDYSDVGHTANPKYAADWVVIDGVKLSANYSTSFVAPPMDSIGAPDSPADGHYNSGVTGVSTWSGQFNLPTAAYPGIAGALPGCAANATSCAAGTSTVQGIEIYGALGPGNVKPETGDDWSVGLDLTPTFLPGFTMNVTLFNDIFKGGVTSPTPSEDVLTPQLQPLIVTCPTGCSQAVIASRIAGTPITGALPSPVYFFVYYDQRNVINIDAQGIDFSGSYQFKTDNYGNFVIGDSFTEFTKFMENYGGGPSFNALNHEGTNTTFPTVQLQMRGHVGWTEDAISVDVFANFTGGYRNWSATSVAPVINNAYGLPISGGDAVSSNLTFDGNIAYNFASGTLSGDQIYLHANNIFDKQPPFYNQAQGYDYFVASPLGRVVSVGLRANF